MISGAVQVDVDTSISVRNGKCMSNQIDLFDLPHIEEITTNHPRVVGCLGVSAGIDSEREFFDYYATDPIAAEWLIKLEKLNLNIWECAAGEGNLSKVFESNGFTVKSTDLIDRGYGTGGIDFLACEDKFDGDIVTNPPYSLAQDFIEHALSLIPIGNKVCMFLKVQFMEGKNRRRLFDNAPPIRIWVSSSRISCSKRNATYGGSMIDYAWDVWEKGYTGDTILKWFN